MSKLTALQLKALNESLNILDGINLYSFKVALIEKMNELKIDEPKIINLRYLIEDIIDKQNKYVNESKNWIAAILLEEK